jgi:hypothetical protein
VPELSQVLILVLLRSKSWGGFRYRRPGHETLNGIPVVFRREVRITLDHRQTFPPAQVLDGEQIHSLHSQSRGEGMAEVMEAEIIDLSGSDGR